MLFFVFDERGIIRSELDGKGEKGWEGERREEMRDDGRRIGWRMERRRGGNREWACIDPLWVCGGGRCQMPAWVCWRLVDSVYSV
jgi:hypothetical protein